MNPWTLSPISSSPIPWSSILTTKYLLPAVSSSEFDAGGGATYLARPQVPSEHVRTPDSRRGGGVCEGGKQPSSGDRATDEQSNSDLQRGPWLGDVQLCIAGAHLSHGRRRDWPPAARLKRGILTWRLPRGSVDGTCTTTTTAAPAQHQMSRLGHFGCITKGTA
jgi:hypothetical protein